MLQGQETVGGPAQGVAAIVAAAARHSQDIAQWLAKGQRESMNSAVAETDSLMSEAVDTRIAEADMAEVVDTDRKAAVSVFVVVAGMAIGTGEEI